MPRVLNDIKPGMKLGNFTIIGEGAPRYYNNRGGSVCRNATWIMRCTCGYESVQPANAVRRLIKKGTHPRCTLSDKDMKKYKVEWTRYKQLTKNFPVVDRWKSGCISGFKNFLSDMGKKPKNAKYLYRTNREEPYGPDNCAWGNDEDVRRVVSIERYKSRETPNSVFFQEVHNRWICNIPVQGGGSKRVYFGVSRWGGKEAARAAAVQKRLEASLECYGVPC